MPIQTDVHTSAYVYTMFDCNYLCQLNCIFERLYHALLIRKKVVPRKSASCSNAMPPVVLCLSCSWLCKSAICRKVYIQIHAHTRTHAHTHTHVSLRRISATYLCEKTSIQIIIHKLCPDRNVNATSKPRLPTTLRSKSLVNFRSHCFASALPARAWSKPMWWFMATFAN